MNLDERPSNASYFARGSISFEVVPKSKKRRYVIGALIILSISIIILVLFILLHNALDHHHYITQHKLQDFYRNSPLREFAEGGGAISTDGIPCSIIGRNILKRSNSAIDAAIAASFCGSLYVMQSMGIGGGFQMIYYKRDSREVYNINAREIAPIKAHKNMFNGSSDLSKTGGLACGVPGELKGYLDAHDRFGGNITWEEIVKPTYDLCVNGYKLSLHQRDSVYIRLKEIMSDPTLRSMFINPDTNDVKPVGTLIKHPREMCNTLEIIMKEGPNAFYNGSLAKDFVNDVQELGGIITEEDLLNYRVKITYPVEIKLKNGYKAYSSPLPGSGPLLGLILKVLDEYNIKPTDISSIKSMTELTQRIVEVFKHTFAFRSQLGDVESDPDNEVVANITKLLKKLSSDNYAREIKERIHINKTSNNIKDYGDGANYYTPEDHGTSHISVLAPNGDAVSITSSVNIFFGACRIGRRTGILLNSGMDDFSSAGYNNYFGVPPSPANFIAPGKSALSSVVPTIIVNEDGSVRLVIGSAGGPKITTSTAYVIVRHLWLEENIKAAIDARRFHHQLSPMILQYEQGFPSEIINTLKSIGHNTEEYSNRGSLVLAISSSGGKIYGNSDWRKDGDVCGFNVDDLMDYNSTIC